MANLGRLLVALPILFALAACESGPQTTIARTTRGFELPWAQNDRCNVAVREGPWLGVASAYRISRDLDRGRQTYTWNDTSWWLVYDPEGVDYKSGVLTGRWPIPGDNSGTRPIAYQPGPFLGIEVIPSARGPSTSQIYAWARLVILLPADQTPDLSGDLTVGFNYDENEGMALDKSHISDAPLGYRDSRWAPRWRIAIFGDTKRTGDPVADQHITQMGFLLEPPPEYAGDTLYVRIIDQTTGRTIAATHFDARGLTEAGRRLREQADAFVRNFQSTPYCF